MCACAKGMLSYRWVQPVCVFPEMALFLQGSDHKYWNISCVVCEHFIHRLLT